MDYSDDVCLSEFTVTQHEAERPRRYLKQLPFVFLDCVSGRAIRADAIPAGAVQAQHDLCVLAGLRPDRVRGGLLLQLDDDAVRGLRKRHLPGRTLPDVSGRSCLPLPLRARFRRSLLVLVSPLRPREGPARRVPQTRAPCTTKARTTASARCALMRSSATRLTRPSASTIGWRTNIATR
eukprot:scaffold664_cov260-Pinguiococcus_pyrenoidosus.AAC.12